MLTLQNYNISADFKKAFLGDTNQSAFTKKFADAVIQKAAD